MSHELNFCLLIIVPGILFKIYKRYCLNSDLLFHFPLLKTIAFTPEMLINNKKENLIVLNKTFFFQMPV